MAGNPRRRRLNRKWMVAAAAILGLASVLWLRTNNELRWRDRPASYWIGRLSHFDLQGASASAEEFLFAAGPGVVPALAEGLRRHDNWLADLWHDTYFKLGRWQRYFEIPCKPENFRANCARGLGQIGPAASNAVPALLLALRDPSPYVRAKAAEALGRIGAGTRQVSSALVASCSDPNEEQRPEFLLGVIRVMPESTEAASAVRGALKHRDPNHRSLAAGNLWRDGSDRDATLQALLAALEDPSSNVRFRAAESIGRLQHRPAASAEALRAALERELGARPQEAVPIWRFVEALGRLGPAARAAASALSDLIGHTNLHTATLACIALARVEPDKPEHVARLVRLLDEAYVGSAMWVAWELGRLPSPPPGALPALRRVAVNADRWQTRVMAATAAWRLDPTSPEPFATITNELARTEPGQYEIVRMLGELGAAARPAVPALRRLRYGRGEMMNDYAIEALRSIAPEYVSDPWRP